jgi:hypothetical protein
MPKNHYIPTFHRSTPHPIFPVCYSTLFLSPKFHKNQNKKMKYKHLEVSIAKSEKNK